MLPVGGVCEIRQSLENLSLQPISEQQPTIDKLRQSAQHEEAELRERERIEAEREKLRPYLSGIDENQKVLEYLETTSHIEIGEPTKPVSFETFVKVIEHTRKLRVVTLHSDRDFFISARIGPYLCRMKDIEKMIVCSEKGESSALFFRKLDTICPQLKTLECRMLQDMSCIDLMALSELPLTSLIVYYTNIVSDGSDDGSICNLDSLTTWSPTLQKIEIESGDGTVLPNAALQSIIKRCTRLQHLSVITCCNGSVSKSKFARPTAEIVEGLASLPRLEHLSLSYCEHVTEDVIALFAKHQKLQHLCFNKCSETVSAQVLDLIPIDTCLQTVVLPICVEALKAKKFFDQRSSIKHFSFIDELGYADSLTKPEEQKADKDEKKSS
jgi:hypothetical protein